MTFGKVWWHFLVSVKERVLPASSRGQGWCRASCSAEDGPSQHRITRSTDSTVARLRNPELNNAHSSTTLGTYRLLGKRKTSNFGDKNVSGSRNVSLVDSDPPGTFPKYLTVRLLCSEEAHNEVLLAPKGEQYLQDGKPAALDLGLRGMREDGKAHTFPSPSRRHLPWPEFQLVAGVSANKDLWASPRFRIYRPWAPPSLQECCEDTFQVSRN